MFTAAAELNSCVAPGFARQPRADAVDTVYHPTRFCPDIVTPAVCESVETSAFRPLIGGTSLLVRHDLDGATEGVAALGMQPPASVDSTSSR